MSKRGKTTNQSTKFQNSKAIWLTVLTGSLIKPSCRLLKLFSKNLEKFTISELSKNSALSELILKFSELRKFLNYLDLENFSMQNLENFQHKKELIKFHHVLTCDDL